jgi:hypothetical protein
MDRGLIFPHPAVRLKPSDAAKLTSGVLDAPVPQGRRLSPEVGR